MTLTKIVCPGCGERRAPHLTALYVHRDGRQWPHMLCRECAEEAARNRTGHARVADAVETYFATEGHA